MSSRTHLLPILCVAALAITGASLSGQRGGPPPRDDAAAAPAVGTGMLGGVVVTTDATPRPIRQASVTLRDTDRGTLRMGVTDDGGRFGFRDLPAGRFTITISKPAYAGTIYGARSGRGQGLTIALGEGQRLSDLSVALARGAVITGRVLDEQGRPITAGPRITLVERVVVGGETTYRPGGSGASPDDRGIYRVYGLAAGTYVVVVSSLLSSSDAVRTTTVDEVRWAMSPQTSAAGSTTAVAAMTPPRGRIVKLATTYYPSVTDPALATPITLAAGEERTGIDVTVSFVPTATISGVVSRQDGQPLRNVLLAGVRMSQSAPTGLPEIPPRTPVAATGEFTLSGMQPGKYLLTASTPAAAAPAPTGLGRAAGAPPSAANLWAVAEVDVNGADIGNVRLVLVPGMTVSGRIVFEGTTPPPTVSQETVSMGLAAPPGAVASLGASAPAINADSTFRFAGVPPGSFLLSTNQRSLAGVAAVPSWVVKSATHGGRDVLDTPFDVRPGTDITDIIVTYTDKVAQVTGLVTDQTGRPAPTYSVIVFPVDAKQWRAGSRWIRFPTRPASDGRFTVAGLPPGEYYLAMINEFQPNEWYTPAFLQQVMPGAIRITLGEGETRTQDLKLAGG